MPDSGRVGRKAWGSVQVVVGGHCPGVRAGSSQCGTVGGDSFLHAVDREARLELPEETEGSDRARKTSGRVGVALETGVTTQRRVRAVRWRVRLLAGVAVSAAVAGCATSTPSVELPLRQVSETPLSGGPVRFDYTALDAARGRLFIAHMGASELIDVDVHAHAVVRTLPNVPDVHGVIVVPDKHRVFATATGNNQVVAIDEDSGASRVSRPDRHLSRRTGLRPH